MDIPGATIRLFRFQGRRHLPYSHRDYWRLQVEAFSISFSGGGNYRNITLYSQVEVFAQFAFFFLSPSLFDSSVLERNGNQNFKVSTRSWVFR